MLFDYPQTRGPGARRSRSLAVSAGIHVLLFLVVVANPDLFRMTPQRVIRISGQDVDTDRFELTELILPAELVEVRPAPPPPEPEPEVAEAAPPPPPPPPEPEPEPEAVPPAPPPPVIGPDDVIAEGARPDGAPADSPEGPRAEPRVTLDEPGGDGPDGDGDGGDRGDASEQREAAPPSEPEPEPPVVENTNPNALVLPDLRRRAESIVDESLAENRREYASGGGRRGVDGDPIPDFSTEEPTILSDTRGYDFGPYMNQVINRVRVNWYSLIPQAARLRQLRGRVVIIFTITKNGTVVDERIVGPSGIEPLDRAALGSILASNPFPRIPDDFSGDQLVLQFTYLYNIS